MEFSFLEATNFAPLTEGACWAVRLDEYVRVMSHSQKMTLPAMLTNVGQIDAFWSSAPHSERPKADRAQIFKLDDSSGLLKR
jgi:hypothetical protein